MNRRNAGLIGAFMIFLSNAEAAHATAIVVDPDSFVLGTQLTTAFPSVILSVEGKPESVVRAVDGFSVFNGRNIATTGTLVFGQDPVTFDVPQGWDENNGLLRITFLAPTDYVQIDLIFDDDDIGFVRGYSGDGTLLTDITTPSLRDTYTTLVVARLTADVAFVIAGGQGGEAIFLDNLLFRLSAVDEPPALFLFATMLLLVPFVSHPRRWRSQRRPRYGASTPGAGAVKVLH